ncbi:MAG: hypothetical protein KC502_01685 [Myxococcales bacterium]|nr:hypothetical protein [Myxococcales bacterium]
MKSKSAHSGLLWCVGLLLSVAVIGCGDDLPTEHDDAGAADTALADGEYPDGIGPGGDVCPGGVGCPCEANDDCDAKLCTGLDVAKVGQCATPCETDGKPGCDDGNPCTDDSCTPSVHKDTEAKCSHDAQKNGTPCDDGNACSTTDHCTGGACSGKLLVCNDNNPCTADTCKDGAGCDYADKDGAPCDDGSVCTKGDACKSGKCASGTALTCDDSNPCTADSCDGVLGCQYSDTAAGCSDGNACTSGDVCKSGVCLPGKTVSCDDGNPCTTDACLPASGCTVTDDDGAACSDGDVCTTGDTCTGGTCAPAKVQSCDDGNPCTNDACDKSKGCEYTKLDGDSCDDGTVCTVGDTCKKGACTPGGSLTCNDGNPCTTDSCDPVKGCKTAPANGAVCVPASNSCDTGGVCTDGACKTVKQTGCNDGNPCTTDTCDSSSGACKYAAVGDGGSCNDGDACTVGDKCKKGACLGAPADCDDNNVCTTDSCDPGAGCAHKASAKSACDDGNLCTVGDTCKGTVCQPGAPQNCGDGNPCTDAACDPASGCKPGAKGASCDDGNACTVGDACEKGHCVSGKSQNCDDGNACTLDSCLPKKGCESKVAKLSCSDGNVCTVGDVCAAGLCVTGKLQVCNDGNPCTTDSCDAKKGCVASSNSASCDDGDVCTSNDVCKGGVCNSGITLSCDDQNGCTDDFCDSKIGCTHKPTNSACDDGNKCTVGDGCKSGKCFPGTKQVCDDKNHCTTDSCHPTKGCIQTPNSLGCDDGNICTVADLCAKGDCTPGKKKLACNDGVYCTDDFCDPKTGCNSVKTDRLCNDGNACTVGDACLKGICVGGKPKSCDDLNKCTDDFCHATKGCIHVANGPNAFKPFVDPAKYNKDYWAFGGSTTIKAFGHAGAGFYRMITGATGSTQTMTLQEKVDLQCTGAPYLYWTERYNGGQLFVEASKDGKIWVPLAKHINISDHIWRVNSASLAQYKGIPVWVRFRGVPQNTSSWWDIRDIRIAEKDKAPPTVPWGYASTCAHWSNEGPAWKCDKTTTPYQLRYHGVVQVPDPNYYANIMLQNLLLDAAKTKNPAITFEERSAGGTLYVDIRKPDGVWENIYTRVSLTDYVWRKRILYVGKYAGSKAQIRFRTTQASSHFGHVRNVRGIDKAPPGIPGTQGVPSKFNSCGLWDYDGSAWTCNPGGKVWDFGWVGDTSSEYNTNYYNHYATWGKRLDLTKVKSAVLRFDRRHYHGYTYLQISETKENWTTVWTTLGGSDYVWRPQIVDLSKFVGKTWYVRFYVRPHGTSYWGQFRNFRAETKPAPLKVSAYGFSLACADWDLVGPSWKCDDAKKPWFLRMDAVNSLPDPGGYNQPATLKRWVDLSKAKAPGFAFEFRRYYSYVHFEVSEDGSAWQKLKSFGPAHDYVWRKAHVDLSKFKGKKIMIRFNGYPSSFGRWGELRNVGFKDIQPVVSVPYTKVKPACSGWDLEGIAWSCADSGQPWHLRFDGQSHAPNPNPYRHHARSKWLLDLKGAKAPTMYFDYRHYYGKLEVIIDGPSDIPKTIYKEGGGYDTVWHGRSVDLSNYAGRKVHVTITVTPAGGPYWGELRNIVFKEQVPVEIAKPGAKLGQADFQPHGGWNWNSKTSRWHLAATQLKTYHWLKSKKAIDLTSLKNPVFIYREATWGPTRYLRVSLDGVNWEVAAMGTNNSDPVVHRRQISLANWKGKKVYIAFSGHPTAPSHWWDVFDMRVTELPVVVKVKPGTQLSPAQWDAEGLWTWTLGSYWNLNHGVTGGSNSDELLPYRQTLSSKVAFDVSGLKKPTFVFSGRNRASSIYVDTSPDRVVWTNLYARGTSGSWPYYWQPTVVDLSSQKSHGALYVRIRGYLSGNQTYWQEVQGATVVEHVGLPTATKGYVVKPTEWKASGEWKWDTGNKWWQVTDLMTSRWHRYSLQKTYSVGSNKSAKLVFDEAYNYGRRYVRVSTNGTTWITVLDHYSSSSKYQKFAERTIDLSTFLSTAGPNPKVYVRLEWFAYQPSNWWRVRNFRFQ